MTTPAATAALGEEARSAIRSRHGILHRCLWGNQEDAIYVMGDKCDAIRALDAYEEELAKPKRRIAHLPPGIPTCPVCLYRNPGAEPGDTRPVGDHDCEATA